MEGGRGRSGLAVQGWHTEGGLAQNSPHYLADEQQNRHLSHPLHTVGDGKGSKKCIVCRRVSGMLICHEQWLGWKTASFQHLSSVFL